MHSGATGAERGASHYADGETPRFEPVAHVFHAHVAVV